MVKLQDELEAEKCEDVATQVQNYRAALLKKMEEKLDALGGLKGKRKKEKQRKRSVSLDANYFSFYCFELVLHGNCGIFFSNLNCGLVQSICKTCIRRAYLLRGMK